MLRTLWHSLMYGLNDASFWDEYARGWKKSRHDEQSPVLGTEWHYLEEFTSVLRDYANTARDALEIGCGGGRITAVAASSFRHVYATDVSSEMLRLCSNTVREPNVSAQRTDGFTLQDFKDATVDVVYSHDVFVHFSDMQVYPYLVEIRRILRAGGVGIVSFYDFATTFPDFKRMSMEFWGQRRFPPMMRVYYTSEAALRTMLADLKMRVLRVQNGHYLVVVFEKPEDSGAQSGKPLSLPQPDNGGV